MSLSYFRQMPPALVRLPCLSWMTMLGCLSSFLWTLVRHRRTGLLIPPESILGFAVHPDRLLRQRSSVGSVCLELVRALPGGSIESIEDRLTMSLSLVFAKPSGSSPRYKVRARQDGSACS